MVTTVFQTNAAHDATALREAYQAKASVLLELTMSLGDHAAKPDRNAAGENSLYRVIPIRSVQHYLEIRKELIRIGDQEFFDSIMVGYKKQRLSHAEFDLNSDSVKAAALYQNLKNGRETSKIKAVEKAQLIMGFPRFLVFRATQDERRERNFAEFGKVRGYAGELERAGRWESLLTHKLHLRHDETKQTAAALALSPSGACVIARPWVNEIKAQGIDASFRRAVEEGDARSTKFWSFIGWSIHSSDQIAETPNAAHLYLPKKIELADTPASAPKRPVEDLQMKLF